MHMHSRNKTPPKIINATINKTTHVWHAYILFFFAFMCVCMYVSICIHAAKHRRRSTTHEGLFLMIAGSRFTYQNTMFASAVLHIHTTWWVYVCKKQNKNSSVPPQKVCSLTCFCLLVWHGHTHNGEPPNRWESGHEHADCAHDDYFLFPLRCSLFEMVSGRMAEIQVWGKVHARWQQDTLVPNFVWVMAMPQGYCGYPLGPFPRQACAKTAPKKKTLPKTFSLKLKECTLWILWVVNQVVRHLSVPAWTCVQRIRAFKREK